MAEQKFEWLDDALANAKTDKEREQILKDYEAQKVARAQRVEEESLNSPTMIDKFMKGIAAIKKKMFKNNAKNRSISQNQQHTR